MLRAMFRRAGLACLVTLAVSAVVEVARADGPYEGEWRQGPMSIDVRVETWGPDCGPRPQSSTVPARGTVRVSQDGDHLSFGGRRSTRSCWSDNRAVRVVSSRVQTGSWTILCRTPADDPRRETGNYTLRASGNERIELRDETDYDWTLNESHCTAHVTTTQSFERVGGSGGTTTTPQPPPDPGPTRTPEPPEPPEPACTPGAPARVVIRPSSTDTAPGERVCFTARVVDRQGCSVRSISVELSVVAGSVGALRGSCLEVTSAGETTVLARAGELEARATVRSSSLDLSGLIARRGETGVVEGGEASAGRDAGVAARAAQTTGISPWLLVVAAGSTGLAIIAAIALAIRNRRRRAELAARAERRASMAAAAPIVAAAQGAAAAQGGAPAQGGAAAAPAQHAMICPLCRRGYGAGVDSCPKDHERLVPYAEFAARRDQGVPERVCPTCGTHYPGTTKFCGKDGTVLG